MLACCVVKYSKILARESEKSRPPTIHAVVKSVKLQWNLGIFNFILRLTLYKLGPLSLERAAAANAKMVNLVSYFMHNVYSTKNIHATSE